MSEPGLKKIKAATAEEICRTVALDESARKLINGDTTPAAFLDLMLEREAFIDATRFLAYALPKREATWWACLCAREALPPQPDDPAVGALKAAEAWVYKPSDENRRAALEKGQQIGTGAPVGWAALAAGWSGGSIGPPDGPAIEPGDNLTPAAVSVAIIEAAAADAADVQDRLRRFVAAGLDIASGGTGRIRAKSA